MQELHDEQIQQLKLSESSLQTELEQSRATVVWEERENMQRELNRQLKLVQAREKTAIQVDKEQLTKLRDELNAERRDAKSAQLTFNISLDQSKREMD